MKSKEEERGEGEEEGACIFLCSMDPSTQNS